jgi:hypothetical protein
VKKETSSTRGVLEHGKVIFDRQKKSRLDSVIFDRQKKRCKQYQGNPKDT